jgi:hypothetical protein
MYIFYVSFCGSFPYNKIRNSDDMPRYTRIFYVQLLRSSPLVVTEHHSQTFCGRQAVPRIAELPIELSQESSRHL